jgi:mannose-6-phosphate isomerase
MLRSPLRFSPIFRRYLWGGRRLGSLLGKPIGPETDYAESWELVDHGDDQSVVAAGPHEGKTLRHLVAKHPRELFGRHAPQPQFPLLVKFLDCCRDLSVQVHPNDDQARRQRPPDLGKTEAWVILHAEPESIVYAGLTPGCDRPAVEKAIAAGELANCLHQLKPRAGDCLFIPAGTVHALGAGFVVAEVQQASDTTFRLYDWDRVGPDGKPRELHLEQALAVTDFAAGPRQVQRPQPGDRPFVERLVACEKFVLDRWQIDAPQRLADDDRFHIVMLLEGQARVEGDQKPLVPGSTLLIPAACRTPLLTPEPTATLLDIYLPD